MKALVAPFLAISLTACVNGAVDAPVRAPDTSHGIVRAGTPDEVNIAASRARATERAFTWAAWSPEAFERARREGKYLLLDGAAEWCHWCHVMDETTYLDPEIAGILRERLVTVRIDVDEHPDLAERYVPRSGGEDRRGDGARVRRSEVGCLGNPHKNCILLCEDDM